MFTGIISHTGSFFGKKGSAFTFKVPSGLLKKIAVADSVAVNGVCLTVTKILKDSFAADVMPETLKRTTVGAFEVGGEVNLELSLRLGDEFGGHIVAGHIDGTAKVKTIKQKGNSRVFTFTLVQGLAKYLVEKGSVAVNGVSLTVISANTDSFTVGIIPYTLKHTNFGKLGDGDSVNIEVDMMAKHVEKLVRMYQYNNEHK